MNKKVQSSIDEFLINTKISVVDIETTGFNHNRDCIVEIGIVELDLATGKCVKLFDNIILEDHFSPVFEDTWIFLNSSLTFNDVLSAQNFRYYKEQIQKIFDHYLVTAYNKEFDFGFLKHRGFKINELPCPMITATNIIKLPPKIPDTLYKWPNVEESWKFYYPDIPYVEQHRAYDDAEHEALIVYEMYKRGHWNLSPS
jgi:DNA polymerase-3 subunit epsilon